MPARGVGDLNIQVGANTRPLADDLRQAGRELEQFARTADRARVAADRAITPQQRGATGAPRMATGAPRSRANDALFQEFQAAKKRGAEIAAAEKAGMDRTAQIRAATLSDSISRFPRQRERLAGQHAALTARLSTYGQPGVMARAVGGFNDAGTVVGGSLSHAAAAGFDRTRTAAAAAGGSMVSFARDAASVATGLVAVEMGLGSLSMAYQHLGDSIKMAADHERQLVGFEVLLRSADDARTLLGDIRRYAAETPFNNRELADSARQLLAYGFAGERIMPTLRMLGDVSAAMPDRLPIGDAAYLYGTLRTQGRAYARDILQFSNRGIDINSELAAVMKRPVHEIPALVEDGRVGFRDVEMAFQRMTREGGRFYGMTARQGQTAAASFEQMKDSIDQLKIAFGNVLIEELDLRGAARDVGAFATRMRDGTNEARPFVRQLGEMARGAVNVGSEFGRASFQLARIGFDSIDAAFPKLRQVRDEVGKLVEDAKAFKLDERQVVRTGFAFGGALVEATADATKMVGAYGDGMSRTFELVVRSARQAADYMATAAKWLQKINDSMPNGSRFLVQPLALSMMELGGRVAERMAPDALRDRQPGSPLNRFAVDPPIVGMSPDRVRDEWPGMATAAAQLSQQIDRERREVDAGRLRPVWLQETEGRLADVRRRQDAYVAGFEGDPAAVRERLGRGDIPPIRRGPEEVPDVLSMLERDLQALRTTVFQPMMKLDVRKFREEWNARLDARLGEIDRRESAAQMAGEKRLAFAGGIGPAAAVPPFAPDSRVLAAEANRYAAWAGVVGGPLATVAGIPDRMEPPRPEAMELGVRLRREFDPRVELDAFRRDLDGVRLHRLAGPDSDAIANRAWMEKVRDVAGRFGIGQRVELPSTVEAGSAEDARLINAWRSQPQATTEVLLQQLIQIAQQQLQEMQKAPTAPAPREVFAFPW